MTGEQKQALGEKARFLGENVRAISFESFKESGVIAPRFSGMLYAIDEALRCLGEPSL